jgi:ferredoxin-NADP reductase
MTSSQLRHVRVAEIEPVAEDIKRFRLVAADGSGLPSYSAGAHVVVSMRDANGRAWRNPYSLMGPLGDTSSYEISVLRVNESRGGSQFMHQIPVGAELQITSPVNLFPIARPARKHLLIAGGIGITPLMAIMEELDALNADFELHYKVRSLARGAYCERLSARYGARVNIYCSDRGDRLSLDALLREQPLGTHMYVCGPKPMIEWALDAAQAHGWPAENLHSEQFAAPPMGRAFTVKLARSDREILEGPQQSILEALEENGVDAPFLCRGGACGQCETRVLGHGGALQHNDHFLTAEERQGGEKIMICMSRISGDHLTLDL